MDLQDPTQAVQQLIELGWTEAGIAARVNSTQPTIHRIKEGGGCFFPLGAALVRLASAEAGRVAPTAEHADKAAAEAR